MSGNKLNFRKGIRIPVTITSLYSDHWYVIAANRHKSESGSVKTRFSRKLVVCIKILQFIHFLYENIIFFKPNSIRLKILSQGTNNIFLFIILNKLFFTYLSLHIYRLWNLVCNEKVAFCRKMLISTSNNNFFVSKLNQIVDYIHTKDFENFGGNYFSTFWLNLVYRSKNLTEV